MLSTFASCGCPSPGGLHQVIEVLPAGFPVRYYPDDGSGRAASWDAHAALVVGAGDVTRSSRHHRPAQGGGLTSRRDVGP